MQGTRIWALALAGLMAAAAPARATDVGVSIGISQPGVYGRIDIGRFPQPELIVQEPVVIQRSYIRQTPAPVYLWVPPGHQQNWRKYCGHYDACRRPVYFVRDGWYHDHGPGREYREGRHHDHDHGNGHGNGYGHGHGHGKGHD